MDSFREKAKAQFTLAQQQICSALEAVDGGARFSTDKWTRTDTGGGHGGGGTTRVLKQGNVFEQGGVNFSEVEGHLPEVMSKKLVGKDKKCPFYATGVSLVIHPHSPNVPTVHANYRYLEVEDKPWFGGGADLTPYVLFEEDAIHFHKELKSTCDQFDAAYFPKFKAECDSYFYLPHRGETRGIGGIFFDYLGKEDSENLETYFQIAKALSNNFNNCYIPIAEKRKNLPFTERQKHFQLLRRGRYVEFNLLLDRGTQFGLNTNGRTESILMSLPPQVRFEYQAEMETTEAEKKLMGILREPRDWV